MTPNAFAVGWHPGPETAMGVEKDQIVPTKESLEDKLQRLVDTKVVAWSGRKLAPPVEKIPLRGRRTVADLLLEDR